MSTEEIVVRLIELPEQPGWLKISAFTTAGIVQWSVVRKEDGTYWNIAVNHLWETPHSQLRVELADRVTDEKVLAYYEDCYSQLLAKQFGLTS